MTKEMFQSEKEKMLAGEMYDASDPVLVQERQRARRLLKKFNGIESGDKTTYQQFRTALLPHAAKDIYIEPPFYCDYGYNIFAGIGVFLNFNCILLDVMPIRFGERVLMGPNVQIYTATHPTDADQRKKGLEFAKPVTIGNDCWIGGGAIILPGVTIGDRCIISAGAVVSTDVPSDNTYAGNPAISIFPKKM